MSKPKKTPAELGALDGARWFKRHPECTGLQAACAAGEAHWKRFERGDCLMAPHVVEYGQAFLKACVWSKIA
jgi:hypothetical protein